MPVTIRGNKYVTVAERVKAFHEDNKDEVVSITTRFLSINDRVVCKATVKIGERVFTGTSAADPNKIIEKQSPYEVAETSAIGRALGFAGYGIVEGIATADEIAKVETPYNPESKDVADRVICPVHKVPMKHNENEKGEWWSHLLSDGTWCNGRSTKYNAEKTV